MISVIVVTYNSADVVEDCLDSLAVSDPIETEIIVVDNASIDGTTDLVKRKYPVARVITKSENVGFARAVNQGAQIARGEYIFLLNPDTVVGSNLLGMLCGLLNNNRDVAVACPRILHPDGRQQASVWNFPTFGSLLTEMLLPHFIALRLTDKTPRSATVPVDIAAASGAALFIRKEHLTELGGLDERFFMYFEDIDFCLRTREMGKRVSYVPAAEVRHHQGSSSWKDPAGFFRKFYASKLQYWQKHFSAAEYTRARSIILWGLLWKRLFYWAIGSITFNSNLKLLGRRYGETRINLISGE